MYESDYDIECDNECGLGPPPIFNLPPPPRPDFLNDLEHCSENSLSDYEMCEAIPILESSYHSGPSLQTSAMILLCSVLLLIFIFVSSILVWKHKRKVQNFLPCKTPTTRGPLDPSVMPVGHSQYEDPDIHHRPLVMRQHPLNAEMLHAKALHYPSGFPMPRSPPLFICSSPGPDPYRSNDNVYEELEHRGRFSDCDRQLHSDEDFAEDELSLPGERSLNKSSSENTTVATIYQERGAGSTSSNTNENYLERNRVERNSLLSSASSSANDNNPSRPNMRNSSSSNESNHHSTLNRINNNPTQSSNGGNGSSSIFRFRTSRPNSGKAKSNRQKTNNFSMDNLNSSADTTPVDEVPRGENSVGIDGPLAASSLVGSGINNGDAISASTLNGNHIDGDTNNNSNICGRNNYYGTESEVERRNRINAQLSNPTLNVATIFRDRNIRYHPARANANYYAPPQQMMANRTNNNGETNSRSRTNPRTDRRRPASRENNNNMNSNSVNNNQEYLYHEPVYHENLVYDPYTNGNGGRSQIYHQPYILPEFTTFRNYNNLNNPHQPLYNSAMGSDSGYSQNTQTSGRSLWGRRKQAGSNNNATATTTTMPSALARNETTSDTYEGS